jgi:hypothetical protein
MNPGKFHAFNQKVKNGLTEHPVLPESAWAANPTLLSSYLSTSEKHDSVYHEAVHGSKLVISQREILQAQLTNNLDEIASVLEGAAIRYPEALLASGFDLTKEQRSNARAKGNMPVSEEAKANAEQPA